jgi:hypothetical protein
MNVQYKNRLEKMNRIKKTEKKEYIYNMYNEYVTLYDFKSIKAFQL